MMTKLNDRQIHKLFSSASLFVNVCAAFLIIYSLIANKWYKDYAKTDNYMDGEYYSNQMLIELGLIKGLIYGYRYDENHKYYQFETEYKVACYESDCIFSCGKSEDERQHHAELASKALLTGINYCSHNTTFSLGYSNPTTTVSTSTVPTTRFTASTVTVNESTITASVQSSAVTVTSTDHPTTVVEIFYQVVTELQSKSLHSKAVIGIYVTLATICLNFLLALVNTITVPKYFFLSWIGMHIVNGLGVISGVYFIVGYSLQFSNHMGQSVLVLDAQDGWYSESVGDDLDYYYYYYPKLQYSFWLFISAFVIINFNTLILIFGYLEESYAKKTEKEGSLVKVTLPRPQLHYSNEMAEEDV